MVSPWWRVCRDLGYPELDVRQYADGEWSIIQYLQTPLIPSLTRWQPVLIGIRNVEISATFIKKKADELNLERGHVWDGVRREEARALAEVQADETRAQERAQMKLDIVKRAPDLYARVMRNGVKELELDRLIQHIDIRDLSNKHRKGLKRL